MRPNALVFAILIALPVASNAGSVYLNGENIDEVRNIKFEKCSVKIDENGNVMIEAQGYRVKRLEGSAPPPPVAQQQPPQQQPPPQQQAVPVMVPVGMPYAYQQPMAPPPPVQAPKITKHYWMVTHQNAPGMTEFDIDVYVNAKWLMTLRNTSQQDVVEVTRFLQPGQNSVTFEAKKLSSGPRKSFSPEHQFIVVIGEGDAGGDNVMINNPLVTFKRTAADGDSSSKDYSFVTR
ncbi:MAG TPA: hypothetical protein VFA20_34785 [Myxococcaceae bacterium]|nr:hypothetical protein [Myxococcaceae bacterium]